MLRTCHFIQSLSYQDVGQCHSFLFIINSRELLSGLVETVHYGVHGRNGIYHVVECFIPEEI